MQTLFWIFIFIVIIFFVSMFIGAITNTFVHKNCMKIKFNSFISFYNIAPNKWILYDEDVSYSSKQDNCYCKFYFSFVDLIKYLIWHYQLNMNTIKEYEYNKYKKFVESVKKDLENFERNHDYESE